MSKNINLQIPLKIFKHVVLKGHYHMLSVIITISLYVCLSVCMCEFVEGGGNSTL